MKHIAFVISHYIGGGAERVSDIISRGLISRGHKVTLITAEVRPIVKKQAHTNYSDVRILPELGKYKPKVTLKLANLIADIKADSVQLIVDDYPQLSLLKNVLPKGGTIIYHPHNTPFYKIKAKTARYHTASILQSAKWLFLKKLPETLFHRYSKRYVNRAKTTAAEVDAYILLSNTDKCLMKSLFPENAQKFIHIPNPLTCRIPNALPQKNKELLYLGRLDPIQKCVDRLLRIFAEVHTDFPDWTLKIVGNGPDKERLINLSKNLGIDKVTTFFDFSENPTTHLQTASILCLTSEYEGAPLVLTEAMANQCVPMAYACSNGVTELLDQNRGVLIPPFRDDEYIKELCGLMASNKKRQQICQNQQLFLKTRNNTTIISRWEHLLTN